LGGHTAEYCKSISKRGKSAATQKDITTYYFLNNPYFGHKIRPSASRQMACEQQF
jgi:hypothetical protein